MSDPVGLEQRLRERATRAALNNEMMHLQPTQTLVLLDTIEQLRGDLHEALIHVPTWTI